MQRAIYAECRTYHVVFEVAAEGGTQSLHHLAGHEGRLLGKGHHGGEMAEQRANLAHRLL